MRVADYVFDRLKTYGVTDVFLVTGGGAMHLNDALKKCHGINPVCCHHEQACAIAAEGYYRASGNFPVVSVTTGPGGTNAITGVIGQWLDSIPCLYISGQVKFSTTLMSCPNIPLRQLGDQEINIIDIVKPVTKYATCVTDPSQIGIELNKALEIATSDRPGPVWLDIPLNVQGAQIEPAQLKLTADIKASPAASTHEIPTSEWQSFMSILSAAHKPVIIAGHGIELDRSQKVLEKVLAKWQIPVLTTFNGMNVIESEHPLFFGRIGSVGQRIGNFVLQNADLIISIGSRNNIRQISYNWENFGKNAHMVVVDIDEAELQKPTLTPDLAICNSAKTFLDKCLIETAEFSWGKWRRWCTKMRDKYPCHTNEQLSLASGVDPYHFSYELSTRAPKGTTIVTGNGMACVAMFQTGISRKSIRIFWNSGCAAMGYDLPASVGAAIATKHLTICVAGDGSMMMNLQELETVAYRKLPLKIFILENSGYMSIRQTQRNLFNSDFIGCGESSGIGFPDFLKVASAFGLKVRELRNHAELPVILDDVLKTMDPEVIVVHIPAHIEFSPKLSARRLPDGTMVSPSLEDMFPFLSREEMAENVCKI